MQWLKDLFSQVLEPIKYRLTRIETQLTRFEGKLDTMGTSIDDENAALLIVETAVNKLGADQLAEIKALQAAQAAGVDTTPQVNRLKAIATTIAGLDAAAVAANPASVTTGTGTGGGTLVASPNVVSLNATTNPSQVLTFTGAVGAITAASANPGVATVSAAAPWTITEIAPGTTNITVTDSAGNTVTIGVTAT